MSTIHEIKRLQAIGLIYQAANILGSHQSNAWTTRSPGAHRRRGQEIIEELDRAMDTLGLEMYQYSRTYSGMDGHPDRVETWQDYPPYWTLPTE